MRLRRDRLVLDDEHPDRAGNAVATVLIGTWVKEIDRDQAMAVLRGQRPFDESWRIDDDPVEESAVESDVAGAQAADRSPEAAHEGVPERVREGASRQPH